MFSSPFAVVATYADVVVAVEVSLQILKLTIKHFLRAENQRIHEVDLIADHLAALCPDVTVEAVVMILITDII